MYLVEGQNPATGFEVFRKRLGDRHHFPVVSVPFVPRLGRSDWLVEMDGIALVPE